MGGVHHLEKVAVGVAPQVLVVPVVVALVVVVGAQVPVALVVQAAGAAVVPLEAVPLLHGEFPQMQMVQIQLDGEGLLPLDGKVQIRKLILVGICSYFTVHRKIFENEKIYSFFIFFLNVYK